MLERLLRMNQCKYNRMIECSTADRRCQNCGWDPDVSSARKKAIRAERNKNDKQS